MTLPPDRPSPPRLTATDISWLRQLGEQVHLAPAAHRDIAITVVLEAAYRYRRNRATWAELAIAVGVAEPVLLSWRDQHQTAGKPLASALPLPPRLSVNRPRSPFPGRPTLVIATGHPKPNNNDFATETARIRLQCVPQLTVIECACVQLAEIAQLLDGHRPAVLHLSAHSDYGSVFLSVRDEPVPVLHSHLATAITRANHRPPVVVLNFCDSIMVSRTLNSAGCSTICWSGAVNDTQCREFNDVLYRSLLRGGPLGASFDDAKITIARWPGLLPPYLSGNAAIVLPLLS